MFYSRFHTNLCALLCLIGMHPAWAQPQDNIKLRSNLTMSTDDNFFRSPASTAVSERKTTQSMGINVSLPYSLQQFELDASLTTNQHQTYSNFDFTAQNYNAAWRWALTPQLHGSLTSTRAETLNAASDSLAPTLRNKNTSNVTAFDALYELGGPWQLTAGTSSSNSLNERAVVGQGDNRSTAYNAGVRYALASGSSIGYTLQRGNGSNTNDYSNINHTISGVWALSGNTSLSGRIVALEQRFAATPQFDFSGTAGSLNLSWRTSGQTSITAGWNRELTSAPGAQTASTQTDTFTASPRWQLSAKTALSLQYRHAVRMDQGNSAGTSSTRQDQLQDTSITYSWEPRPFASLSATLTEARRTSNTANLDYVSNLASVAAQFSF